MAFVEDFSEFFDTDGFAITATVTISGSAASVNGIFENEFYSALDNSGSPVETAQPVFSCASADISGVAHGSTVKIGTTTYNVVGIQPDGTGVTRLSLEEQ